MRGLGHFFCLVLAVSLSLLALPAAAQSAGQGADLQKICIDALKEGVSAADEAAKKIIEEGAPEVPDLNKATCIEDIFASMDLVEMILAPIRAIIGQVANIINSLIESVCQAVIDALTYIENLICVPAFDGFDALDQLTQGLDLDLGGSQCQGSPLFKMNVQRGSLPSFDERDFGFDEEKIRKIINPGGEGGGG